MTLALRSRRPRPLITSSRSVFALLLAGLALVACDPRPIGDLTAEDGIMRIRADHESEKWEQVITEVNEYRSRYPYSQYAADAELLQADAMFQSQRYPEAVSTYQEFLKKNPSHPQAPFALFRIGRSYDLQSPREIDREQAFAITALEKYSQFLEKFPKDKLAPEVLDRVKELRRRLAEHDAFVARFYWKKDMYESALSRYLDILDRFPMYDDLRTEAAERAAKAYRKLADRLERDPKDDKVVYFRGETPASLRKKADEVLARGTQPQATK